MSQFLLGLTFVTSMHAEPMEGILKKPSDGSNGDGHGAAGGGVDMAAVMGLIGSLTDR